MLKSVIGTKTNCILGGRATHRSHRGLNSSTGQHKDILGKPAGDQMSYLSHKETAEWNGR